MHSLGEGCVYHGGFTMFNKTQIRNIAKYLWHLSVVMVQSGALAGILLPKVPIMVVVLTIAMAFLLAVAAVITDGFVGDDKLEIHCKSEK